MTHQTATPTTITADALLQQIRSGEAVQLVDVRDDRSWGIEGPQVSAHAISVEQALADPAAAAAGLEGPVVVVCNRGISAQRAADALRGQGVDARVLEGGMRGWIMALWPVAVETGIDGLQLLQVQRPGRGCLSYVAAAGGQAIVVDPAPDAGFYLALAEQLGVQITAVVDTHLHADHISGARALADAAGATLRLPAAALERGVAYADRVAPLHDGDRLELGPVAVRVVALPGHTTDMTGLVLDEHVLIGGDSLFADGIARPDLQEGDPVGARAMARRLHATIHERVLALGDDAILLPGHANPGVLDAAIAPTLGAVRAAIPALAIADPAEFAEVLLAGMPPRPANYQSIIAVNSGTQAIDPDLETGGNSCSAG
jgi:glyoxylase-like metal-dependent hydrolase (beta-lactamase superfamily II)